MLHILYTLFCLILDVRRLNNIAIRAKHTGMIILGGGVVKHHICNANLMVKILRSLNMYCNNRHNNLIA